jgi:hypothetical protein
MADKTHQLGLPFDVCRNRHGGNEESVKAYQGTLSNKDKDLANILEFIRSKGHLGATSDECGIALGIYVQTCSARCSELTAKGHVLKKGVRETSRGSAAAVLVAKEFYKENV